MRWRLTTIGLATALAASLVTLAAAWRLPGDNQGYEPVQPIAFSHKVHAGDLRMSCLYCHGGAEASRYAGIPSMNICMNCHMAVTASRAAVLREEQAATREHRSAEPVESRELP